MNRFGQTVHLLVNGWTYENDDLGEPWDGRFRIFRAPDSAGYVTVDYVERAFRSGISRYGKHDNDRSYGGHGWRKRLELDAQTWLAGILAK